MFDPTNIWTAAAGLGGILVGGFITYHQVQRELVKMYANNKEEHETFMTKEVCGPNRTFCAERFGLHSVRSDKIEIKLDRIDVKLDLIKEVMGVRSLPRVWERVDK